ncbi:hypothetical protein ENKNEFLB_03845 [Nocardioides aquaticus]|uniref:Uncharacterized protein n=1 Tax=Nocardioides aquaticus TaxID=160826 RepID=A0ABX8ELN2_9ACTN|nr:hypothetical protein [Nocardioides aquaticus]QVT81435.1 hypothetical protein ENKNEFLB_03845 [Nocardioides aquaticus]
MRGRRHGPAPALTAPALATLALLLGACGGEGADDPSDAGGSPSPVPASSSAPTPEPVPTPEPTPSTDPTPRERVLDVVALSAAGGTTDTILEPVALPADATAFVAQFEPSARGPLRAAIDAAQAPPGLELQAAVVAVGCDEPADVLLNGGGAWPGWRRRCRRRPRCSAWCR